MIKASSLGQLLLVALALALAAVISTALRLAGLSVGPDQQPFTAIEYATIALLLATCQIAMAGIAFVVYRQPVFASRARLLLELHYALWGVVLAGFLWNLATVVPFKPLFFLLFFLMLAALYGIAWLALPRAVAVPAGAPLRRLLWSGEALLTAGLLVLGLSLAAAYKVDPGFAHQVRSMRVALTTAPSEQWALQPIAPELAFAQPMDLRFAPRDDDLFFVLERGGRLYRMHRGPVLEKELLLDFAAEVGPTDFENGAITFALHPRFGQPGAAERGFVYVYYTHVTPERQENRLARFDLALPDAAARRASELRLIAQERNLAGYHNGGTALFGADGMLYLSLGDFTQRGNGQKLNNILAGGIIRIDVDQQGGEVSAPIRRQPRDGRTQGYQIPRDNPFVGRARTLEEYWAVGLRNPFRMAFDPADGAIWLGDVGEDEYEEISRITAGDNGQWPFFEGPLEDPKRRPKDIAGRETPPVYAYRHTGLDKAVIGGIVYRGDAYPALRGRYLYGDNSSGLIRALDPARPDAEPPIIARTALLGGQGITAIIATPDDQIWLTVLGGPAGDGAILALRRAEPEALLAAAEDAKAGGAASYAEVSARFDMLCATCHGVDGKGAPGGAEMQPPDFTAPAWQDGVADAEIRAVIVEGGAARGLSANMPSWEGAFSPPELDLLVQKIRAFGPGRSTS